MCLYILPRWHIVVVFWRRAMSRVGTQQERRRICHFTLGGNPSRVTIVLHNRQEMVEHIILTHWALWHAQFYCCHRWMGGRKHLLVLPRTGRDKDAVVLCYLSLLYLCFSLSLCVFVSIVCPRPGVLDYYGNEKTVFKGRTWLHRKHNTVFI